MNLKLLRHSMIDYPSGSALEYYKEVLYVIGDDVNYILCLDAAWKEVKHITGLACELPPWQIVKEKRATFAATPQQNALRPGVATRWRNVHRAGDWVQTGLPATMEGAILSGTHAAQRVLAQ